MSISSRNRMPSSIKRCLESVPTFSATNFRSSRTFNHSSEFRTSRRTKYPSYSHSFSTTSLESNNESQSEHEKQTTLDVDPDPERLETRTQTQSPVKGSYIYEPQRKFLPGITDEIQRTLDPYEKKWEGSPFCE